MIEMEKWGGSWVNGFFDRISAKISHECRLNVDISYVRKRLRSQRHSSAVVYRGYYRGYYVVYRVCSSGVTRVDPRSLSL